MTRTSRSNGRRRTRRQWAYPLATSVSVGGTTVGVLTATGALSRSVGIGSAGLTTAVYVALVAVATSLTTWQSPRLAHRYGLRRLFLVGKGVTALTWLISGILLVLGAPPVPVLYCAALFMGVGMGATRSITAQISAAYLATDGAANEEMSQASARIRAYSAAGGVIGALIGGILLNTEFADWGLLLNAALTVPLLGVCLVVPPIRRLDTLRRSPQPTDTIRHLVGTHRELALVLLNASIVVLFLAPLVSLVVPLTEGLRAGDLVAGAGLLLAGISAGELLVPRVVRSLKHGRSDLTAPLLTTAAAAGVVLIMGVASVLLSDSAELLTWMALRLCFGALRYASQALSVGAAVSSVAGAQGTVGLAALTLTGGVTAPLGVLLWGALIDVLSPSAALVTAGTAGLVTALAVRGMVHSPDHPPSES